MMKKIAAFAAMKGKKDKGDSPGRDRKDSKRDSLKKASSVPTINEMDTSTKKKNVFKGGSFRNTLRGNKHRPQILANGSGNSPFVAGDGSEVRLTSIKGEAQNTSLSGTPAVSKKTETATSKQILSLDQINEETSYGKYKSTDDTPKAPKHMKKQEQILSLDQINEETSHGKHKSTDDTPKAPKHMKKQVTPKTESTKSSRQKKPLPPLPHEATEFSATPVSSQHLTNGEAVSAIGKKDGKRKLESSPNTSASKKKRTLSPKQLPVQPVSPLKKEKPHKKKFLPIATMYDSTEEARKLFECMMHPVQADMFLKELWQKKPLLVRRHIPNYNDGWFSTAELDKILEKEDIQFGVNLDVTSYQDGKRETHNPPGRAYRSVVWDYYQNGCSVRMLNPQTYSSNVWKMLSTLQEFFGCCVGANVYLTPPGTQGFAPHYDDIEAFILQLEGKKHWRLYNPRCEEETLPRESSGNFDQSEIGSPILNVTLHAGDLLYFPRGTIHQGYALEDAHSLHITVSCYQKNTWGDLFQTLVPRALQIAMEEDIEFREGLPLDYLSYMGLANSDLVTPQRDAFIQKAATLLTKMIQNYTPVDAACDQMGKKFIHDSLPPVISDEEKACSVHSHGEHWDAANYCVKGNTEIDPDTMIKLIRKGCLRLITEEDAVRVYHNLENARVYHGKEPQFIEISADLAPAVEFLLHSYPEYVSVDSLPPTTVEERVEIANILYDKGLIITGIEVVRVVEDQNNNMILVQDEGNGKNPKAEKDAKEQTDKDLVKEAKGKTTDDKVQDMSCPAFGNNTESDIMDVDLSHVSELHQDQHNCKSQPTRDSCRRYIKHSNYMEETKVSDQNNDSRHKKETEIKECITGADATRHTRGKGATNRNTKVRDVTGSFTTGVNITRHMEKNRKNDSIHHLNNVTGTDSTGHIEENNEPNVNTYVGDVTGTGHTEENRETDRKECITGADITRQTNTRGKSDKNRNKHNRDVTWINTAKYFEENSEISRNNNAGDVTGADTTEHTTEDRNKHARDVPGANATGYTQGNTETYKKKHNSDVTCANTSEYSEGDSGNNRNTHIREVPGAIAAAHFEENSEINRNKHVKDVTGSNTTEHSEENSDRSRIRSLTSANTTGPTEGGDESNRNQHKVYMMNLRITRNIPVAKTRKNNGSKDCEKTLDSCLEGQISQSVHDQDISARKGITNGNESNQFEQIIKLDGVEKATVKNVYYLRSNKTSISARDETHNDKFDQIAVRNQSLHKSCKNLIYDATNLIVDKFTEKKNSSDSCVSNKASAEVTDNLRYGKENIKGVISLHDKSMAKTANSFSNDNSRLPLHGERKDIVDNISKDTHTSITENDRNTDDKRIKSENIKLNLKNKILAKVESKNRNTKITENKENSRSDISKNRDTVYDGNMATLPKQMYVSIGWSESEVITEEKVQKCVIQSSMDQRWNQVFENLENGKSSMSHNLLDAKSFSQTSGQCIANGSFMGTDGTEYQWDAYNVISSPEHRDDDYIEQVNVYQEMCDRQENKISSPLSQLCNSSFITSPRKTRHYHAKYDYGPCENSTLKNFGNKEQFNEEEIIIIDDTPEKEYKSYARKDQFLEKQNIIIHKAHTLEKGKQIYVDRYYNLHFARNTSGRPAIRVGVKQIHQAAANNAGTEGVTQIQQAASNTAGREGVTQVQQATSKTACRVGMTQIQQAASNTAGRVGVTQGQHAESKTAGRVGVTQIYQAAPNTAGRVGVTHIQQAAPNTAGTVGVTQIHQAASNTAGRVGVTQIHQAASNNAGRVGVTQVQQAASNTAGREALTQVHQAASNTAGRMGVTQVHQAASNTAGRVGVTQVDQAASNNAGRVGMTQVHQAASNTAGRVGVTQVHQAASNTAGRVGVTQVHQAASNTAERVGLSQVHQAASNTAGRVGVAQVHQAASNTAGRMGVTQVHQAASNTAERVGVTQVHQAASNTAGRVGVTQVHQAASNTAGRVGVTQVHQAASNTAGRVGVTQVHQAASNTAGRVGVTQVHQAASNTAGRMGVTQVHQAASNNAGRVGLTQVHQAASNNAGKVGVTQVHQAASNNAGRVGVTQVHQAASNTACREGVTQIHQATLNTKVGLTQAASNTAGRVGVTQVHQAASNTAGRVGVTQVHQAASNTAGRVGVTQVHQAASNNAGIVGVTHLHQAASNTAGRMGVTQVHQAASNTAGRVGVTQVHQAASNNAGRVGVTQVHQAASNNAGKVGVTQVHQAASNTACREGVTQIHQATLNTKVGLTQMPSVASNTTVSVGVTHEQQAASNTAGKVCLTEIIQPVFNISDRVNFSQVHQAASNADSTCSMIMTGILQDSAKFDQSPDTKYFKEEQQCVSDSAIRENVFPSLCNKQNMNYCPSTVGDKDCYQGLSRALNDVISSTLIDKNMSNYFGKRKTENEFVQYRLKRDKVLSKFGVDRSCSSRNNNLKQSCPTTNCPANNSSRDYNTTSQGKELELDDTFLDRFLGEHSNNSEDIQAANALIDLSDDELDERLLQEEDDQAFDDKHGEVIIKDEKSKCSTTEPYNGYKSEIEKSSTIQRPTEGFSLHRENTSTSSIKSSFQLKGGPPKEKLKCPFCPKEFKTPSYLPRHLLTIHEFKTEKPRICKECKFEAQNLQDLVSHKRDMHGSTTNVLECKIAGCHFQSLIGRNLVRHVRMIHGQKDFCYCLKCCQSFNTRLEYKRHKCNNTGSKSHCCHFCGEFFKTAKSLKSHFEVHGGEYRFFCALCDTSFKYKYAYENHIKQLHVLKDKMFQCSICSGKFLYKTSLYRHQRTIHHVNPKDMKLDGSNPEIRTEGIECKTDATDVKQG